MTEAERMFAGHPQRLRLFRAVRAHIERIGPVFSQFYGQAEAPMSVTLLRKSEHDVNDLRRLASCGRPVPWVKVALLDANGVPVIYVKEIA